MQTSKTRNTSKDVQQRASVATPRAGRKLKIPGGSDSDSVSSPNPTNRTPKNRTLKINDRQSPQNSSSENQLVQLQEELKKAREQLSSSESLKKRAQREAEEAKKQIVAMAEKLEEYEKQMVELSDSEEARLQELRKISQDRDRAWQSELEAVQKQHEMDYAALASAMSEIHKLKIQLDRHAESAHGEIHHLRMELRENLELVEDLKAELNETKESEAKALKELKEAQMQLEVARLTEETLRGDILKAEASHKSMALELELEQSKNQNTEISQLRDALESSERRYQEEYIQSTLQIRTAYELLEKTKSESLQRETQMEAKLKAAKSEVESLKENLMEKDAKLQKITDCEVEAELKKSEMILAEVKACLLDKETELQCIAEENSMLKSEIQEREITQTKDEQLNEAKATNLELEAELRRLKVQSNQWRKAVEAAASIISTGNNNGKYCMDYHTLGGKLGSPLSDDIINNEDDSPKKKNNGNMLKKIGVLLKKSQK